MVFSSAIFLFFFLPILYLIYRLVPGVKAKNAVLLVFSLVFYCFGDVTHLPVLLLGILVNWGAGFMLCAMPKQKKTPRRVVLAVAVVYNLGVLAAYKYLDFMVGNVNALFGSTFVLPGLGLPLGVSFFTFTAIGYVTEVYRKPANGTKNLLKAALFISLFPNILSGPILSWKNAAPQLDGREHTAEKTAKGFRRFTVGLAKKLLVADIVGRVVDAAFASSVLDARLGWLVGIGYAVQIYFDFSGYSDMALGLASAFGFDFPENFDHPYIASSMTDFWKRWHISLTTWFRNYLYMPLVMSKPLSRLYKRWSAKYGRQKANKLSILIPSAVVWLLTGLWHGAAWSFVLWGVWEGLFCVLEGVGILQPDKLKGAAGRVLAHIYTLAVVIIGSVLFRAGSVSEAVRVLGAMLTGWRFLPEATLLLQTKVSALTVFCLLVGVVGSMPVLKKLAARLGKRAEPLSFVLCAGLLVLCIMNMAVTGFQPFIYLQF